MKRFLRDPGALAGLLILAVVTLVALLAPVLAPGNPTDGRLADTLAPIGSPGHRLGADGVGRDVFAMLVHGARTSVLAGFVTVAATMLLGVPFGVLAGYYRGWIDGVTGWISNALMSLPAIVVILVVLARVGRDTLLALAVFGVLMSPAAYRLIRASVTGVREELYVDAARVSGLRDARIMRRHILPVVIAPSIIQAAQFIAVGVGIEAGISFLGVGSADRASWGIMLNDAAQNLYNAPRLLIWPSVAIIVTILGFSLVGNALRDALGTGRVQRSRTTPPVITGTPGADALLVVENLRVAYGPKVVVDGVSLTVRKGEVLGLVGESGSGKSQTAFSVLGLLPPDAALTATALHCDGQLSARLRGHRIGYIPQEPMANLDPCYRIGQQLIEPMRHHLGLSAAAARTEALRLLARVGINEPERVYRSYPHQISGGMAQRVLIAGAVSCNPDLLIADEPTTALDVTVQAEVLDLIRDLQAERGMGVILVTHDFGVVADLCDTVAVMRSGRIVETAPAAELFASPQHEYTRMLLGSTLENTPARGALEEAR